jgi:hypothetical protein
MFAVPFAASGAGSVSVYVHGALRGVSGGAGARRDGHAPVGRAQRGLERQLRLRALEAGLEPARARGLVRGQRERVRRRAVAERADRERRRALHERAAELDGAHDRRVLKVLRARGGAQQRQQR